MTFPPKSTGATGRRPPRPEIDQGPGDGADPVGGQHDAENVRGIPEVPRDVDGERGHERRGDDRRRAPEQDRGAQHRLADDVVDPLADLRQQPLAWPVHRSAQIAAHEGQADGRQRERCGIDGQRGARSDGRRQESGDGRADDVAERVDGLEVRVRAGHLRTPDQRRDRCGVAREEERAEHAHRCGHDQDHRHGRTAEVDGQRDHGGQGRAPEVGQEHHPLAVAAVGERPGDHPEDQVGQRLERPDDAHRQPGAGQREDEQGERGEADRVPQRRDALGREEHLEIAVARQPFRIRGAVGHRFDGSGAVSCEERGMVEWRNSP